MIDLSGKTVLVTGGSRGIGAATVRLICRTGGRAVVHYGGGKVRAEALKRELGEQVHLVQADLMLQEETEKLWDAAVAWRGKIDVLVNNAGVYEKNPVENDIDDWMSQWDRTLRINLLAAAQLCRRAVLAFR